MNTCPCCSEQLLRHIRQSSIYWFCARCKQEMPALELINPKLIQKIPRVNLRKNSSSNQIWMTVK
ncbi:hypothetical protein Mic7113_3161 [Allocoleopsis franciscana PCC 7113]|uniref:Uncharacterized protein n=1 Tax=Allocoleopsis franciscana PCC 7113 TaxID=1173027 RepID=K9WFA3_9CYAN|nr:hypothetical protein [Allocoleopsis franciscana]AFZ18903.1 hypothetical protein Mic7113_3161 [Allocoleopsis franciscana PCC 7113]